ncbi:MAG: uracil-DNA glycosylase family protein [Polyangiaceae bacterium]
MIPPVVLGRPRVSPVMLIGQAPGPREGKIGHPFGWTAGTTLFRWFGSLGVEEETFRERAYIAAVCRCFPGKASGSSASKGDRVPSTIEIANCRTWMQQEIELVRPRLVLPVGRLAIEQVLARKDPLASVIGHTHQVTFLGARIDVIPLPHPSGLSAWHKVEPGKTLLTQALALIKTHEAWESLFEKKNPLHR